MKLDLGDKDLLGDPEEVDIGFSAKVELRKAADGSSERRETISKGLSI